MEPGQQDFTVRANNLAVITSDTVTRQYAASQSRQAVKTAEQPPADVIFPERAESQRKRSAVLIRNAG